jgi:hypothetical protein
LTLPVNLPKYKNINTGVVVIWLAQGSCQCAHDSGPVAIYCPDNNEHDIYVMPQDLFEKSYEAIR